MSRSNGTVLTKIYEKADSVFFAVGPTGVMLHNYAARAFLELDAGEELLWKYCDGTLALGTAIDRTMQNWPTSLQLATREALELLARRLVSEGFLCARSPGPTRDPSRGRVSRVTANRSRGSRAR